MNKLILLGGPPGIGKTSVLNVLPKYISTCALFDADDIWRTYPQDNDAINRSNNIVAVHSVLRSHLASNHSPLIFAWVFANPALVDDVLSGIKDYIISIQRIYLVASPDILLQRLAKRSATQELVQYSLGKLKDIDKMNQPKIDTSSLDSEGVAQIIASQII